MPRHESDSPYCLEVHRALDPATGCRVGERLSVADLGLFAQLHSLRTHRTPWQQ